MRRGSFYRKGERPPFFIPFFLIPSHVDKNPAKSCKKPVPGKKQIKNKPVSSFTAPLPASLVLPRLLQLDCPNKQQSGLQIFDLSPTQYLMTVADVPGSSSDKSIRTRVTRCSRPVIKDTKKYLPYWLQAATMYLTKYTY